MSDGGTAEETSSGALASLNDVATSLPGPFAAFSQAYTSRIPEDEFPILSPDELTAELSDAFQFLAARGNEPAAIRLFDPKQDDHGYRAPGTVVEIVTDDSPFLIDSVLGLLTRRGYSIARHFHPVVGTVRDIDGSLLDVVKSRGADHRESFQHYELVETLDADAVAELSDALARLLGAVRTVVSDFRPMKGAVETMVGYARDDADYFSSETVDETVAFLEWLLDDNFVFLGYREYEIVDDDGQRAVMVAPDSGLGLLSNDGTEPLHRSHPFGRPPRGRARSIRAPATSLWCRRPTPTRRCTGNARMDYVGLRRVDPHGVTEGEARLIGLFTSKAYMVPAASIPILRGKLEGILEAEDLIEGSHDYKVIVQLFESFPKDELFSIAQTDLRESLVGLLESEEHQRVRLFVRRDRLNRNVSVLVVAPRERFNAELRQQLQQMFLERFEGESIDYRLSLGESGDARIHFTIWPEGEIPDVPTDELENEVYRLTRTWEDRVFDVLSTRVGDAEAKRLVEAHGGRFPAYYQTSTPLPEAATTIVNIDRMLGGESPVAVGVYNEIDSEEGLTRIAVYSKEGKRDLSEMLRWSRTWDSPSSRRSRPVSRMSARTCTCTTSGSWGPQRRRPRHRGLGSAGSPKRSPQRSPEPPSPTGSTA